MILRAILLCVLLVGSARAQEAASPAPTRPIVTAELSADRTLVGQPLVLRVTVLVPTFMPKPPVFPSFDAPNLIVRLPERATGPVSQTIAGETWSGVSRAYRLYPMVPGEMVLPAQSVTLTYADPQNSQPVKTEAPLEPVSFTATIPAAAEGLDPLILASDFTLEQEYEGGEETMGQGDAVIRTVTASIAGTSPLFIPPLIPDLAAGALKPYAKEPVVSESEDRGTLSGKRVDSATYVAQFGGSVDLPEISIDWFDIDSGEIVTAQVPGRKLTVDAPPPADEAPPVTGRQMALLAGVGLLLLGVSWLLRRYLVPPLRKALARRRAAREASEAWAAKRVERAIARRDLSDVLNALALWSARCPGDGGAALETALADVGAARFGRTTGGAGDWQALTAGFRAERRRRLRANKGAIPALPPLNPS